MTPAIIRARARASSSRWWSRRPRRLATVLAVVSAVALAASVVVDTSPAAARDATPSDTARCIGVLAAVQAAGLILPPGFEYRCPGDTQTFAGDRQHWGVVCYRQAPFCPTGAYVAVNPSRIGPSDARMRYVVAHEIGHALDYVRTGSTSEASADAHAAAAGFPR